MTKGASWGVVIVNYNSARFTLDAALSVLGDDPTAKVVIVDNASPNNSLKIFDEAITLGVHAIQRPNNPIADLDLKYADISAIDGRIYDEKFAADHEDIPALSIVKARKNRGFAAGCNIGLRFLRQFADCSHFLMLNPDALVGGGALHAFEQTLRKPGAGLCGATVLLANKPGRVQAFGGACLNPVTLMGENIGGGEYLFSAPDLADAEAKLTYPLGAAIALTAEYLATIGYMDERYFLYYEEADWAFAGRKFGRTVWAREAYILHHYGVSSRSDFPAAGQASQRSPLSEYHMARSRVLFALKWRPWLLPIVLLTGFGQVLTRLIRGRRASALALLRGVVPGAARQFRTN